VRCAATTSPGCGSAATGSGDYDVLARTSFDSYVSLLSPAVDSHGNLIVAGYSAAHGVIVRYTPDGALDTSFGNGGMIETPGRTTEVLVDGADNITVSFGFDKIQLARYRADGTLDTTFGVNGIAEAATANSEHMPLHDMALNADGRLIAVGILMVPREQGDAYIARFETGIAAPPAPAPSMRVPSLGVRPPAAAAEYKWSFQLIALPDSLLEPKEADTTLADWLDS
jgi:uncharacterized delta-60 repeat protein